MLHRILGCMLASLSTLPALAQTSDSCAAAQELEVNAVFNFDTAGASIEGQPSCVAVAAGDVWFRHTPTITGYMIVEVCSVSTSVLSAYTGCPGSGTQIACSNQFRSNSLHCGDAPPIIYPSTRQFVFPATAGTPILVRIASDVSGGATSGIFKIAESLIAPNDSCANAAVVTPDSTVTFDTVSATYTPGEGSFSCGVGPSQLGPDLWYRFTPAVSGNASVRVANILHNSAPVVSIHPACGAASIFCGRANYAANGQSFVYGAQVTFPVATGTTYLIRVATGSDFTFPGTLDLSIVPNPPVNDTCAAAADVILTNGSAAIPFDLTGATNTNLASCNTIAANNNFDIWYRYVPTAAGSIIFSACRGFPPNPGSVPVQLAAYADCSGNGLVCGTDEVCVATGIDGNKSWLDVPVTPGVPVYVRIATAFGVTGNGLLLASYLPPPANDHCSAAPTVGPGIYPFSTFSGSQDRTASCNTVGIDTSADVWFRYVPTTTGVAILNTCADTPEERLTTTLTAYADCNPATPELLGCDSKSNQDLCFNDSLDGLQIRGQQGLLRLGVTAGQPLLVRVASAASFPVSPIRRGTRGTLHIAEEPRGTFWFEGNTPRTVPTPPTPAAPDAGDLLATAQAVTGSGLITKIYSASMPNDRADLFKIRVTDAANFNASLDLQDLATRQSSGSLFLFDAAGRGLAHVHTSFFTQQVTITAEFIAARGNGIYYLAVAPLVFMPVDTLNDVQPAPDHFLWLYDYPAFSPERAPDGPAAANPLAGWSRAADGDVSQPLRYTVNLIGVSGLCIGDFNGVGGITVQDIFDFLAAYFTSAPAADVNSSGTVTVQDIFDFLVAYFAGCN